jgi:flavin-dependent dehydrogenase
MKDEFEPGIKIKARQTVLTEGCRGSLTEKAKKQFDL